VDDALRKSGEQRLRRPGLSACVPLPLAQIRRNGPKSAYDRLAWKLLLGGVVSGLVWSKR
jgi:hypothetical protein